MMFTVIACRVKENGTYLFKCVDGILSAYDKDQMGFHSYDEWLVRCRGRKNFMSKLESLGYRPI